MARKISSTELLVASAYSTGLESHSVNKIYSVEVLQHIEDFTSLANEIKRIMTPDGIFSFCAHLSTNQFGYNKLRQDGLRLDEIEILAPVDEVVKAFQGRGLNVNYHSIGEFVFEGYERWITQIQTSAITSHNIYNAYKSEYIDYYVFIIENVDNVGMCYARDEL